MKKLRKWMEREQRAGWFSLELNLLILFVLTVVSRPGFGGGEKRWKEHLAADFESAVSDQNGCLRVLYEGLQGWMDKIPWYALIQYVLLFGGFFALTYVIMRRMDFWYGTMVSLLLLMYFGYECYIHLEYARTAAVLSSAGFLLIFYSAVEERGSGKMIAGWLLGMAGAMYQVRVFGLCALIFSGIFFYELLAGSKKRRIGHRWIVGCLGLFLLVAGSLIADRALYAQNEEWKLQREYHTVLKRLEDYGLPEYAQNQELYQQFGISKKKYKTLRKGKGLTELSTEELKALDAARGSERLSKALLLLYMERVLAICFQSKTFFCFLILAIFWLIWGRRQKAVFAVLGYELFLLGGLYFCLFYRMRESSFEHDLGLWMAFSLLLIWFLKEKAEKISGNVWLCLGLCLLAVNQKTWQKDWRMARQAEEKIYTPFDVTGEGLKEENAEK